MQRVRAVKGIPAQTRSSKSSCSAPTSKAPSRTPSNNPSRAASRATSDEDAIDDDTASVASLADQFNEFNVGGAGREEAGEAAAAADDDWMHTFKDNMDHLSEKRASVREAALKAIVNILCRRYIAEELDGFRETLLDALKRIVHREKLGSNEGILASHSLALMFVTLGSHNGSMYAEIVAPMKYAVSHSASDEFRAAAVSSLAMSCFIASEDDADTRDLSDFIGGILASNASVGIGPRLMAASLRAFGLLFSCMGATSSITSDAFYKHMPAHLRLLQHAQLEVRIAAAENAALMFEILDYDPTHRLRYDSRNVLMERLHELAKEGNKHVGKKNKSVLKTTMRDVLLTIEEGEMPELKLKFNQRVVYFDSWTKMRRLHSLRAILGVGLQIHAMENETVQDVFGFDETSRAAMGLSTNAQYRQVVAQNSDLGKARALYKTKARATRHSAFDGEDGY